MPPTIGSPRGASGRHDFAEAMTLLKIAERPSPNHAARNEPLRIDMLVLHYTGMMTAAAALDRLCDPVVRVSAHYLVEEDGAIWRLVSEARRAFHAGHSCWAGEDDLNHVSIGIEIVNPGHEWGYRPFPEEQMTAVERLCRDLVRATRSRRIASSVIRISRPTERAIPASCSIGPASPARVSGSGRSRPLILLAAAAEELASSSAPQHSPTSPGSATASTRAGRPSSSRHFSGAFAPSAGMAGSMAKRHGASPKCVRPTTARGSANVAGPSDPSFDLVLDLLT